MKLFFELIDILESSTSNVGSKALNLAKANTNGIEVPASYILPSSYVAQEYFNDIRRELKSIIDENSLYAVRSSASVEDMDKHSAAGIFDSFIAIKGCEAIFEAIMNCYKSFNSNVANKYINIGNQHIYGGIIIQKLINAKRSGVAIIGRPAINCVMAEGVWGLAIPLVSGMVNPAFLIYNIDVSEITQIHNSEQDVICVPAPLGEGIINENKRFDDMPFFDQMLVKNLIDLSNKVINIFGKQYEIEWAEDYDGKVWLIQARPLVSKTLFSNIARS